MLNATALANAITAVTAVFYLVCLALSTAAPDVLFGVANAWAHSINLEAIETTERTAVGTAIIGLVTISALAWVTTYATVWLYNRWAGAVAR